MEYKTATGGVPGSLYETVVSFSNTDGGIVVLGADDEGVVIGIDPGKLEQHKREIVSNLKNLDCISPALFLQPVVVDHEDGSLIVLRVPASSQLHQHADKIYWRSDDNDQDITTDQLFYGPLDPENFNPYPKNPNIRKFFAAFGWTDELGSGVRNVTRYLNLYVKGARPVFMENDIFITEIPLVNVTLADYREELFEWLDFSDEVRAYLTEQLDKLSLNPALKEANWKEVLLELVPSWTQKGAKLDVLDWPDKQVSKEGEIKKVPSWHLKGTKLLHKKVRYLIEILLLSLEPVPLDKLMEWMGYAKKQTFRDNYLKPLQQVGYIKMTIPEVPRSPDQKYVTTAKGRQFLTGRE